eukprot:TRINITY_DN29760_c0_g1_i1.p1 TRINITY_DN29760_c0_g1~~TRINITY_DN29760_c0_g1_i1.p1  ORF type:complete len:721 (+),score=105.83 TRINITY_DN29760_c0_g1_i1:56-2218(+)
MVFGALTAGSVSVPSGAPPRDSGEALDLIGALVGKVSSVAASHDDLTSTLLTPTTVCWHSRTMVRRLLESSPHSKQHSLRDLLVRLQRCGAGGGLSDGALGRVLCFLSELKGCLLELQPSTKERARSRLPPAVDCHLFQSVCTAKAPSEQQTGDVLGLLEEVRTRRSSCERLLKLNRSREDSAELVSNTEDALRRLDSALRSVPADATPPELVLTALRAEPVLMHTEWALRTALCGDGCRLSRLAALSMHPAAGSIHTDLCRAACQPFRASLVRWLQDGVVDESDADFFIRCTGADGGGAADWQREFSLEPALVPGMFDARTARMVLEGGRCVAFMRRHCGLSEPLPAAGGVMHAPLHLIGSQVAAVHAAATGQLLCTLRDSFHLYEHIRAVWEFTMCADATWFDNLRESLGDWLSLPLARALERRYVVGHAMAHALKRTPLARTLAVYDHLPTAVNDALTGSGDTAMGVFALEYKCPPPCCIVLHEQMMAGSARSLGAFLFRVRSLRGEVIRSRPDFKGVVRAGMKHQNVRRELWWLEWERACSCGQQLQHALLLFMNAFLGYLLTDGVGVVWKRLELGLDKAACVEDVVKMLDASFGRLAAHFFIDGSQPKLQQMVEKLLRQIANCVNAVSKPLQALTGELLESCAAARTAHTTARGSVSQRERAVALQALTRQLRRQHVHSITSLLVQLGANQADSDAFERLRCALDVSGYFSRSSP